METPIEQKINQLIDSKPITDLSKNKIEIPPAPTMIEEAKALREELKILKEELKKEREKLDNVTAQALLSGRSILGNQIEKTPQQLASERANEVLKAYGYGK